MAEIPIKRSMIFIDAGNLNGGWWEYCKSNGHIKNDPSKSGSFIYKKVSYEKLLKEISKNTDLIRGYYYDATEYPIDKKKQAFFDVLRRLEVTINTKPLKFKNVRCQHCGHKDYGIPYQKGVDVSLVTEVMSLAFENAFDIAIIVSGDNDFQDAVHHIKSKGKKVWIVSFQNCLGEDVKRAADRFILLDPIFDQITQ